MASVVALDNHHNTVVHGSFAHSDGLGLYQFAASNNGRWTYLISDQIKFNATAGYAIRLSKPQPDCLVNWLEKIITSGQCGVLFVEALHLSELDHHKITALCQEFGVALVNLFVEDKLPENVLLGPWKN